MRKELLTIEFRYSDKPKNEDSSTCITKTITIGTFNTLEEAINEGNIVLKTLSKAFEVRADNKFRLKYLFGSPCRLVTNCCYPTNGIQYFAKITQLKYDDLSETITETFEAIKRYRKYKNSEEY